MDNAVSAVCRMMRTRIESCYPDQVLPVLLSHIPLKTDMTENENVYGTLRWLLQTAPLQPPLAVQVLSALLRGLTDERVGAQLRMESGSFVTQLFASNSERWREVAGQLPPEQQQQLRAFVVGM